MERRGSLGSRVRAVVLWSGVALAGRAIGYTRQVQTQAQVEMPIPLLPKSR